MTNLPWQSTLWCSPDLADLTCIIAGWSDCTCQIYAKTCLGIPHLSNWLPELTEDSLHSLLNHYGWLKHGSLSGLQSTKTCTSYPPSANSADLLWKTWSYLSGLMFHQNCYGFWMIASNDSITVYHNVQIQTSNFSKKTDLQSFQQVQESHQPPPSN